MKKEPKTPVNKPEAETSKSEQWADICLKRKKKRAENWKIFKRLCSLFGSLALIWAILFAAFWVLNHALDGAIAICDDHKAIAVLSNQAASLSGVDLRQIAHDSADAEDRLNHVFAADNQRDDSIACLQSYTSAHLSDMEGVINDQMKRIQTLEDEVKALEPVRTNEFQYTTNCFITTNGIWIDSDSITNIVPIAHKCRSIHLGPANSELYIGHYNIYN